MEFLRPRRVRIRRQQRDHEAHRAAAAGSPVGRFGDLANRSKRPRRTPRPDLGGSLRDRLTVAVTTPLFPLFYLVKIRHRQFPLKPTWHPLAGADVPREYNATMAIAWLFSGVNPARLARAGAATLRHAPYDPLPNHPTAQ